MNEKPAGQQPVPHATALSERPAAPAHEEKLTPEDHAVNAGMLVNSTRAPAFGEERQRYSWQHEAAAQLHGWEAHKLATVEPLTITREAYDAALKAIESTVTRVRSADGTLSEPLTPEKIKALKDTSGVVHALEPHAAAMSRYSPKAPKEAR